MELRVEPWQWRRHWHFGARWNITHYRNERGNILKIFCLKIQQRFNPFPKHFIFFSYISLAFFLIWASKWSLTKPSSATIYTSRLKMSDAGCEACIHILIAMREWDNVELHDWIAQMTFSSNTNLGYVPPTAYLSLYPFCNFIVLCSQRESFTTSQLFNFASLFTHIINSKSYHISLMHASFGGTLGCS